MGSAEVDLRPAWLEERVLLSLKVKATLFKKLLDSEGSNRPLLEFLNNTDAGHLFFMEGPKELQCFETPPPKATKKCIYFVKLHRTALTAENMDEEVISGELVLGALSHMYRTCQEVPLPGFNSLRRIIRLPARARCPSASQRPSRPPCARSTCRCCPTRATRRAGRRSSRARWSTPSTSCAATTVLQVASVYVTIGQTQGKTLLPLPAVQLSSADRTSKDKERVHVLETAVVTWTRQIKNVLKQDPEQVLKSGTHPGPLEELGFWRSKANNLNSIQEQLQGEKIRKVVRVLDLTKSTYYPAFNRLCKEAAAACTEANDNVKYLATLKKAFEKMTSNEEFAQLTDSFRPVVHLIMMVWKHSKHYNTPARLVVLMREICNDLIRQARSYVDAEQLFQMDPPEAVERLMVTLRVCGSFKSVYFDYKSRASSEVPNNPWRIQNTALFPRLDSFLERCHDLLDLCKTVVQFQKLEKVEVGGNKGRTLSASVYQIYADFTGVLDSFKKLPYDVLDVETKQFDDDFYEFRCQIKELERRLGSVLNQGFEDCATVFAAFKLIESFEGLLEREFIQADLERKHVELIKAYGHDLKDVQDTFNVQKQHSAPGKYLERQGPPLYVNMPPVSGALFWLRGLIERIEEPMLKLKQTMRLMLDAEEAKEVTKLYTGLLASLREFEAVQYSAWGKGVDDVSQSKLKQPLLTRDAETRLLSVNFDPALVRLLREVKYFIPMDKEIPKAALELHGKAETFRVQIGNLDLIVGKYNQILISMLDVEQPLLQAQLKAIDKVLEKGQRHLTWRSHAIDEFVREATTLIKDAFDTLNALKANMRAIQDVLNHWVDNPLMKRKASKTYLPEEFEEEHAQQLAARYAEITEGGKEVHKLLLASNRVLKVSKGAPIWKAYVEFINDILIDGLARTVANSLKYLNDQQDPAQIALHETAPLLEVQLELLIPEVQYDPQLSDSDTTGSQLSLHARVDGWVQGFFRVCKLVKRLDRSEGDFLKEVAENEAVRFYVHSIRQHMLAHTTECNEFKAPFNAYSDLWTVDIGEALKAFIVDEAVAEEASAPSPEPGADGAHHHEHHEAAHHEPPPGADGKPPDALIKPVPEPPLALFDQKIVFYKETSQKIGALPGSAAKGFLRVDAKPVKQALSTWVTKWMFAYTQHLQSSVVDTLAELSAFMEAVNAGLAKEVDSDDVAALVQAMTYIRDVRLRTETVDGIFEPLRGKVMLLKKYALALPDSVIEVLDHAPFKWEDTKKASLNARERLAPLQALQAEKIKEDAEDFGIRVAEFRKGFLELAPFSYDALHECYDALDAWHVKISEIEAAAAALQERELLFDVAPHQYKEIRQCRQELLWLKQVWDFVELVENIFVSWRQTLWPAVNVDAMLMQGTRLQKEVKGLVKQCRSWGVYTGLAQQLSDMLVALPLVQDLRDEAIRERHWKKLMRICGRSFVMDEKMCLQHLLALNLQNFVDSVAETVEQARMELKIDKQLARIDATWMELQLEYEPFKSTGVYILRPADLVIEALDDNEVALQNMMGNRFMGFFESQIHQWKGKLGTVRAVLESWMEVQRQWCSLEAIFVGSEDIREQLPEDAKRFDMIDASFKEQMVDAVTTPNPLDACLRDGRDEEFAKCLQALELCQRSLSDYLETKRKKFPRFYFISAPDLVDVLSKGKHPPAVQEHFYKFTDAIAAIGWMDSPETGQPTGVALQMSAGDGEVVPFGAACECRGAVEDWLGRLMRHCAASLRDQLGDSVNAYLELPRDKWIGEYCAQLILTTSQIWWTSEVNQAFDRLEQGNETALKDYAAQVVGGLNQLTNMVLGELSRGDRTKVKTLITIEVHARDVLNRLVAERVDQASSFSWQSQLKYRWDEEVHECFINIADAEFKYSYEYTGNCGRLVITALTDRCYITLTQAMRLILGGAPAGPAGTGKTETTKDLGRGLAIWVIVQNCSDQMNYKTMANIFSGLAQTGAWGCFDEFNRIPVEVLSVVAGQYSSILDAIKAKKSDFLFDEELISLTPTIGAFITMNPGYAGRTELPENLKALFRPCAMVVPDFVNICEIELAAEGFMMARVLAVKFVTLFSLNSELLSKQDHYDWGLRAMKGVLRIAGGQKRANPERTEMEILMRALRDSNLPKFVQQDVGIFMGLIGDLFPKVEAVKMPDKALIGAVKEVIKEEGRLQAEEVFVAKTVDLCELLAIRHCVFILGAAGAGKTQVWQTLQAAQTKLQMGGGRSVSSTLNPKAVTSDELYGYVHPTTKEYSDGIIAKIMRDFSKGAAKGSKWVVLDGDIDAEWIESMNTVMDDNKVLTLVSNERIPLTPQMRLIFEISHLKNASPATVSRAGVLYLNETDVGWQPYVQSWVDKMAQDNGHIDQKATAIMESMFSSYVPVALDHLRKNKWKHITPLADMSMIQSLCALLEGMLTKANTPQGSEKEVYEAYFNFACIWAFGGALGADKANDYRKLFSEWWRQEWQKATFRFPDDGLVFDYTVDAESKRAVHWRDFIPGYTHVSGEQAAFASIVVPTMDTTRLTYLIDLLAARRKPLMLVGNSGSAKTTIFNDKLAQLPDEVMSFTINLNSYTDASALQAILEQPLEKKTGSMYGPPGTKRLVYFIDDVNMPTPDKYGTQSAIELLRQQVDYGGFYDLKKLTLKTIENVQYMGCMNPTAGSFAIIDRMQRHFATFACPFPDAEVLKTIYLSILSGHLANFDPEVAKLAENIVGATLALHKDVADSFLPTAVKFHYQWNLRELSAVTQGLCAAQRDYFEEPMPLVRLWLHEVNRVYGDRLVNEQDAARFQEQALRASKGFFEDLDQDALHARPLAFATFANPNADDKVYLQISDGEKMRKLLEGKLAEYNESNQRMSLVLFEQAMEHVCRISRIIDNPRGNALLVGVGGSGKQSLTRLAAFIGGHSVFQIKLTQSYGMADFKQDVFTLYSATGLKGNSIVFLFTDQQIVDEKMLVYLNDLLSTGYIPELYSPDDKDNIINAIRPEVKQAGLMDSRENCWEYFIDKVRANLHVVLCMSPVGDAFRIRCRKFPALTNCTAIDWFHPWPRDALISVAQRFLEGTELGGDDEGNVMENVAHHMAFVHEAVGTAAAAFVQQERRQVYTTPKSYLELITLYKRLMAEKQTHVEALKQRLETGLVKLRSSAAQVADMQVQLRDDLTVVEAKKAETDALLVQVGQESTIADEQAELGAIEESKVAKVQTEVSAFEAQCKADLAAAEPAIQKAESALNSLDKKSLVELKSMTSPPKDVLNVMAAVQYMLARRGSNLKKMDVSWAAAKKTMGSAEGFLQSLLQFDKDNLPLDNKEYVRKYTGPPTRPDPTFNYEYMKTKSLAAAGLCEWVVNICTYHDIYLDVEPKRQLLQDAQSELAAANAKLTTVRDKVAVLEERKRLLQDQLVQATEEKNGLIEMADRTAKRLNLAERLVNGLKDENERWGANVESLQEQKKLLVGDAMVAAPFIAYVGPFNGEFRAQLLREQWLPDLYNREIPASPMEDIDVLRMLSDDAQVAGWKSEGLPADRLSLENAAIITNCSRWPLMIDPQLQGVQWIKKKEAAAGLIVAQQSQAGYLNKLQRAMEEGLPMLLEAVGENFDAVMEPVLARSTIQKGRKLVMKLGDREVYLLCAKDPETDLPGDQPLFKLYLQTKLPNPHYIPEIQAQTSLVNFSVTEKGLEDQLLAEVVLKERFELEEQRAALVEQQNAFTIKLKELEDDLLQRLANAEGDILGDEALIISLEETKATSIEINAKVEQGKRTEVEIAASREAYRPIAARGSLIFFLIEQLYLIDHMYQFSLETFNYMFEKALSKAPAAEGLEERGKALLDCVTFSCFAYVTRGLFEAHRTIFSSQLAIKILSQAGELSHEHIETLIRSPKMLDAPDRPDPMSWLAVSSWQAVHALAEQLESFAGLPADMEGSWKRWKEWCDHEQPESEPLPQEWKRLPGFERLLLVNALRPDRMMLAVRSWVKDEIGAKYVNAIPFDLGACYEDSGPATPIFFLLSPGVDPVVSVKALGKTLGMTEEAGSFFSVSLGQGQEPVAEKALDRMHASGGWVMLQNIELVARWLPKLEKKLEALSHDAHADFRVFLSSLPQKVVPVQILQNSMKLTNEPPSGLRPNMLRAYASFGEDVWEGCGKQAELKAIIFALSFFHSVVCERRKFGPIGWNRSYPFNQGDLTVCITVSANYLNDSAKVPWDDLRYLFGEIMYGGHITDNWDRRLCSTYLNTYLREELLDGLAFFPRFEAPPNLSYKQYCEYIDEHLAKETPAAFGLHPNSEINFMQQQADELFRATAELQPRGASASGGMTLQEKVKRILDDILERLPELFALDELDGRVDERTPFTSVFLQECERMNLLLFEMRRSLLELDMGLKGDLSISEAMETLMAALYADTVPATWTACAWPSLRPLASWLSDMLARHAQLAAWTGDLSTPRVTWLPGLFNPQAFLTAVMQVTARKNELPLDKLAVVSDVTKKSVDEIEVATREGAYIHGLYLDGARWDAGSGMLDEAHLKVLYPLLPVVLIKAATQDKMEARDIYPCPVYKTQQRGPTFVFAAGLRTKAPPAKWTMAGVALLLDVGV